MAQGPKAGLALIDEVAQGNHLENYYLLHAARADLLRRMGALEKAAQSYRRALSLVSNVSERLYLERWLKALQTPATALCPKLLRFPAFGVQAMPGIGFGVSDRIAKLFEKIEWLKG